MHSPAYPVICCCYLTEVTGESSCSSSRTVVLSTISTCHMEMLFTHHWTTAAVSQWAGSWQWHRCMVAAKSWAIDLSLYPSHSLLCLEGD